jgi:two-component system, LytTR family, sensor kinase
MKMDFIFWIAYIACYLPWGFLTALTFRLEGRFPLGVGNTPRNLTKLAIASIPMSLIAAPLMRGAFEGTLALLGHPVVRARTWSHWFYELFIGEFFYWLSVGGAYSLRTLFQLQRQKEMAMQLSLEKSRLEASLRLTQLEVLRAKLNPHFLFNSLQNISVLTRQDPLTASRMLSKLGDLLRAVLRTDSQAESSLYEEIALTQRYMALEQMRFGDRLRFHVDIPGEAQKALVPASILQPLVENAIVHGLREVTRDGLICVQTLVEGQILILVVTDNGVGIREPQIKSGLGLSSTRERLDRMYPGTHSFSVGRLATGGTEVRIAIPLLLEDEDASVPEGHSAIADR